MWLVVDSGNTRVKWAYMKGDRVLAHDAVEKARFELPPQEKFESIWVSHVGSYADLQRLKKVLAGRGAIKFVSSQRKAAGVTNTYGKPSDLGVDRWLCLLGAWRRHAVRRHGALVVSAGTAITIDVLQTDGRFVGGVILPGIALMPKALAAHTPLPEVSVRESLVAGVAKDTAGGVAAGAVMAAAGAVVAVRRQHLPGARVLLVGGDADLLQPHLSESQPVPRLLFTGMARLRREQGDA